MVSFVRPRRSRRALGAAAVAAVAAATFVSTPAVAAPENTPVRQMEYLDRAPVAVTTGGGVYVGWRMLGLDADSIGFHVYRDGVRITETPITGSTNLLDAEGTGASVYRVTAIIDQREVTVTDEFTPWGDQSLDIPLQRPAGGTTPAGEAYEYEANDASVGDLDGDGEYEIVLKWNPTNAKDNSRTGYTGNVYLDAYKLDGTRLWQIDLGRNIRAGAHYTQFQVFDYDGDGRAEVAMKTADATVDGAGTVIGDAAADHRNTSGRILTGPEYLTVFEGATGVALDSIDYVPARGVLSSWGDTSGNRMDRFLAGTAYLDGEKPSMIFSRGYYTKTYIAAFDFVNGKIQERWLFDSTQAGNQYAGQGNHNLSIADVDADGADEIVFGSMTIDSDGTPLYTTGLGHGDAMHVTDHIPSREGLEVYSVHESMPSSGQRAATMRDAATGEILWSIPGTRDTGRGAAGDIDPTHEGNEAWAIGGTYKFYSKVGSLRAADGTDLGTSIPAANFLTWWDGDLLREITDHDYTDPTELATGATPTISKWNWESKAEERLLTLDGTLTGNGTKGNPALQADLFGDWREELVYRSADHSSLRIFTTTDVTEHRIRTLMHDPVYRLGVAWQNTAYNQPPHTSFFLGEGMTTPPAPGIAYVNAPVPDETAPVVTEIKDTKVGAKHGLVVDVQAEDPESGVRSLTVTFNGQELTGVNGRYELPLEGLKGSFELSVTAINHAGIETTATAEITVRPGNGKPQ